MSHSASVISFESGSDIRRDSLAPSANEDAPPKGFTPVYRNNSSGLVAGWFVLIVTISFVILVLYDYYAKGGYRDWIEDTVYSLNLTIAALVILATFITMYQMSSLGQADVIHVGIHRQVDQNIMVVTFSALIGYKLMSMISALGNSTVIIVDGTVCFLMGFFQNIFLSWYVHQVRATEAEHVMRKPGRQGLEFIRICNIALWLINVFLLRHQSARRTQQEVFGIVTWSIMSNIFQPLVILFFFINKNA